MQVLRSGEEGGHKSQQWRCHHGFDAAWIQFRKPAKVHALPARNDCNHQRIIGTAARGTRGSGVTCHVAFQALHGFTKTCGSCSRPNPMAPLTLCHDGLSRALLCNVMAAEHEPKPPRLYEDIRHISNCCRFIQSGPTTRLHSATARILFAAALGRGCPLERR